MSGKESTRPAIPFLLRHFVEVLTLVALAFILQTGFVPFDFRFDGASPSVSGFFHAATKEANFPDIVANIFLYVPLGAFLHWALKKQSRLRAGALPLSLLAAAVLSVAIEWCQAFSPSRVSSVADVVCNISGAGIGAALSWIAQILIPRMMGATLFELRTNPRATVLKLYCLLLVVFAAIPFSFSLGTSQLKKATKSAVLVPFGAVVETPNKPGDTIERTNMYDLSMARWEVLKRWSRWTAECASFGVLVWLMIPLLRGEYRFTRRATLGLVWWLAALFAVAMSVLQFPIMSRGLDTTDILFRLVGVALGLATYSWYTQRGTKRSDISQVRRRRRLAGIACVATVAYIIYTGVLPLVFDFSDGRVEKSVASPAFQPFIGYFATRFDVMFTDVMEKCASYAVFAALLATAWTRIADRTLARKITFVLPVGLVVCVIIECVQVFLPVRIPSLTDPILTAFGCFVGVTAQVYAVDCWRFAQNHEMLGPGIRRTSPAISHGRRQGHSLTDQLVGSLIEPNENAPREPSPSQHPSQRK